MPGSGHESGLASFLQRQERRLDKPLPFYLPLTVVKVKNGIVQGEQMYRHVSRPLFPGYAFLNGPDTVDAAYESDHCGRVEPIAQGMQEQLTGELIDVARALAACPALTTGPLFPNGRLVKIAYPHKLAGMLGRVAKEYDGNVYVNVPLLNAGIPIAVEPEYIELMPENSVAARRFKVCCGVCGRDTKNASGICDRCS
jgi:hypothetical protein